MQKSIPHVKIKPLGQRLNELKRRERERDYCSNGVFERVRILILVTPKQEVKRKKVVVLRHNFFCSSF